jgi:FkbM family methyltransferase
MFSLAYLCKASLMLLRYPLASTKIFEGSKSVADHIDESRRKRWAKSQITEKHIYGFWIELNKNDHNGVSPSIAIDGWYEPEQTELLRKILKKNMVFIDVGANIGWYTLLATSIIGPGGTAIAFEPEPVSLSLLKKSIKRNEFKNINLFNQCVSSDNDKKTLWIATGNCGGHSIMRPSVGSSSISVPSITLDFALENLKIKNVDILKIDAEGAEPEIIKGAHKCLKQRMIQNIFLEYSSSTWQHDKDLFLEFVEPFEVYKYIRSPLLIKKTLKESLFAVEPTNLYLQLKPE